MNFTDQTPNDVLQNPFAEKLLKVLDGTHDYKQQQIAYANRFYRSAIFTQPKFLRARLEEHYGFPALPDDFPLDVLQALTLNAEEINALRGSKQGLLLWLWCLTFGNITVVDTYFQPIPEFIQLSDPINGFVSKFFPLYLSTSLSPDLFLFDDMSQFGQSILQVDIDTKYDTTPASILTYINTHIKKYLTFVTGNASITVTLHPGVYTQYGEVYPYFMKP